MLYISRRVWPDKFCVIDTDDGAEDIVSFDELDEIATKYNITIKGAPLLVKGLPFLGDVAPYQIPDEATPMQLKFRMMYGIEVTTHRGVVTNIKVPLGLSQQVVIRLSDFGSSCADCILFGGQFFVTQMMTIVLDNKIALSDNTFCIQDDVLSLGAPGWGFNFDLRELEDPDAERVYRMLYEQDHKMIFRYILDRMSRFHYMENALSRGLAI